MEQSPHVFLSGAGAEEFAREQGAVKGRYERGSLATGRDVALGRPSSAAEHGLAGAIAQAVQSVQPLPSSPTLLAISKLNWI